MRCRDERLGFLGFGLRIKDLGIQVYGFRTWASKVTGLGLLGSWNLESILQTCMTLSDYIMVLQHTNVM